MKLAAILGVVKSDPKATALFTQLLGDVVLHPVVATDLEAVQAGTMTPLAFIEKDEAVLMAVLDQVDAAFDADPTLLPSILTALTPAPPAAGAD